MTPAELRRALDLLTGDVKGVAAELGCHRMTIYAMLEGRNPVQPRVDDRIRELLRERRDAIDAVLTTISI